MLRSMKSLDGYKVSATDGDLGTVDDFLLEDTSWVLRYLVVKTSTLMLGGRVLITPSAFRSVDYSGKRFRLSLSMTKVENSPGIELDAPVSRQKEREYYGYYAYQSYWEDDSDESDGDRGDAVADGGGTTPLNRPGKSDSDVHLRSAREITGYHVEATDGSIGHVSDVVVDDETWEIKYLVVATANWLPGRCVLISPLWASRISWLDRRVSVDMTRDAIRESPEWTATYPVERLYADQLFRHYAGIPGWAGRDRNVLAAPARARAEPHASSNEPADEEVVGGANARAAAHEEEQVVAADRAVIADARAGRMP